MPTPNTPQDAPSLNPKSDAAPAPLPDLGDKGAVSSPDYAAEPKKGVSLDWHNVEGIWDQIRAAKQSGDPAQWDAVVAGVRKGLKEWMVDVNKWPAMAKKYMLFKSAFDNAKSPEQKQRYNDELQKMREQMPLSVRKAAEARKPIVPIKLKVIEDLMKSLEGIRQADYETYPAQVRSDLRVFEERIRERQRRMRTVYRALLEKLDGVKGGLDEHGKPKLRRRPRETEQEFLFRVKTSEEKLKTFMDRRDQLLKDKSHLEHELAIAQDAERAAAVQKRLDPIEREWKTLAKRERGVQDEQARRDLEEKISHIESRLMDDAQIRARLNKEAELRKYDALISLVTSVAMPIKVLHTRKSTQPSMKTPYLPTGGPKQSSHPEDEIDTIDVNVPQKPKPQPKAEASETYILSKLVMEGHYDEALSFWLESFHLNSGDLVVLEAAGLEGLKGRVREIDLDNAFAIIDLFKNDKIAESSVEVELYCARPYLQD